MIRIAIQAKGRLNEQSLQLLQKAGINIGSSKRKLLSRGSGFPIEVLYLRDNDIPNAVAIGAAHIGIVGQNEIAEKQLDVRQVMPLGFGNCRLSIAVPDHLAYPGSHWLIGKRIATSYPVILKQFFDQNNVNADIQLIEGSVEIAPAIGMSDAIFDIVSSGATLLSNGLKEAEVVMHSQAVLIANNNLAPEHLLLLDQLAFRFKSIVDSIGKKYVLMNLPKSQLNEAVRILPGMKSPTVLPLAQENWCSIHAVISEDSLWESVSRLKEIGAEDILVLNLENMIR